MHRQFGQLLKYEDFDGDGVAVVVAGGDVDETPSFERTLLDQRGGEQVPKRREIDEARTSTAEQREWIRCYEERRSRWKS